MERPPADEPSRYALSATARRWQAAAVNMAIVTLFLAQGYSVVCALAEVGCCCQELIRRYCFLFTELSVPSS